MSTAAARLEDVPSAEQLIQTLEQADERPDDALRAAVDQAAAIAPAVIAAIELAAAGEPLTEEQHNLLFWGIHVLAAARRTELYRPLLQLLRSRGDDVGQVLGDAKTITVPKIVISVFDGDPAPLIDACADRAVDDFARWELINALARLTFDGAVPRDTMLSFLDRFEREPLADPDDEAWQGWQDAICRLGLEQMRERLIAACREDRFLQDDDELEYCLNELTLAQNLAPGNDSLFVQAGLAPIEDPVAALDWLDDDDLADDDFVAADPASEFALNEEEITWLCQFLTSRPAAAGAMSLEAIDGYYSALVMQPDWGQTRESAAQIFSSPDESLYFDNKGQESRVGQLLSRHLRTIATRLDATYAHAPLLEDSSAPKAKFWAQGFVTGMQESAAAWPNLIASEEIRDFLSPVLGLTLNDYDEREGVRMTPELRADCITLLPSYVLTLYAAARLEAQQQRKKPAVSTKIGRNEPCPCGSGKKYKRCCGSPESDDLD